MIKQAVIMAGGEGLRLRPFTYMIPKPLLPFGDMTVIEHSIKRLAEDGIKEIFILTLYQNHRFDECLKYQDKYNIKLNLIREPKKMGTIGGLYNIRDKITGPFILMNGDIITELDFEKIFKQHVQKKSVLTIGVKQFDYQLPYGLIKSDENGVVIDFEEKPRYKHIVNTGIYVINSEILKHLDGSYTDFTDFLENISHENYKICSYLIKETWRDMGQVQDYENALELLRDEEETTKNC